MAEFSDLIRELYQMMWGPLLGVFVGAAALWGAWVGSRFLFAGGDEQKLKKAKEHLKSFIIGIVIVFVVAAGLPLIVAAFQEWAPQLRG